MCIIAKKEHKLFAITYKSYNFAVLFNEKKTLRQIIFNSKIEHYYEENFCNSDALRYDSRCISTGKVGRR